MLPAFDSPEEFWAMMGCGMEILRGTATVVLACFLDDHSASSVCSCYLLQDNQATNNGTCSKVCGL